MIAGRACACGAVYVVFVPSFKNSLSFLQRFHYEKQKQSHIRPRSPHLISCAFVWSGRMEPDIRIEGESGLTGGE